MPEPGGTRIEGYFDVQRWAKYFVRIWLAFAVLVGPPIFTNHYVWGDLQANPNKLTGDVLRYGGCDHCPQMSISLVLLTPVMAPSIRQASSIR